MKPENISDIDWKLLKEKYPNQLEKVVNKIKNNYPVQYLIGNVDFYDCIIQVNENVLIPRFETELLVDKLIKKLQNKKIKKVLDLGTGSGCIAIALKKNLNINMTAIDISKRALNVAKENAKLNHTEITFINSKIEDFNLEEYDIIISNPPYVRKDEFVGIETKYEPQNALFADKNGLYFYEIIMNNISKLKKKPYLIAFEIGCLQGKDLEDLHKRLLPEYQFSLEKDYQNRDRFVFLERNQDEHN